MSSTSHSLDLRSLVRQPRAVWAVAFAAAVSFMGIGLVDPILPEIAKDLQASPSQVSLLFTSYMLVTGLAMLVTGVVSSRIGAKKTLMAGLVVIVAFATASGLSGSVGEVIGFRAGWGLGNALFIATALATIVGAASGGAAAAIMLYEAALGLGIAAGPLVGGLLGSISWRGPFFGTAVLMTIALVAVVVLLPSTPVPARRISPLDPLRALRHRGLLAVAVTAFLYNMGFFTLLAYGPFPLGMDAIHLGLVFFGWGLGLAVSSVFLAPVLRGRFGRLRVIGGALLALAALYVVMALAIDSVPTLVVCVVAAGLLLGVLNTLLTESVMEVSDLDRGVASSAYSFVRFTGGAIAPYVAGRLGEDVSPGAPLWFGTAVVLLAVVALVVGRGALAHVDRDPVPAEEEAAVLTAADAA